MKKRKIAAILLAGVLGLQASFPMAAPIMSFGSEQVPVYGSYHGSTPYKGEEYEVYGYINRNTTYVCQIHAEADWNGGTTAIEAITYAEVTVDVGETAIVPRETFNANSYMNKYTSGDYYVEYVEFQYDGDNADICVAYVK